MANAESAKLEFRLWIDTERDRDYVGAYVSTNGENFFWGTGFHGQFGQWSPPVAMGFDDIATLGNVCGQDQVWIAFIFKSDGSGTYRDGVMLDNIKLSKCVSGCAGTQGQSETSKGWVVTQPQVIEVVMP